MDDKKMIDDLNNNNEWEALDIEAAEEEQSGEDMAAEGQEIMVSRTALSASGNSFTDMEEYPEDPFTYFETNQVNVQLNNASFRYEVTDFALPGRNGFDLAIARRYDSGCANTAEMSSNMYNGNIKTGSRENKHNIRTYGLGYGWSFILPSIESIPHRVYGGEASYRSAEAYILHLEDGRSLKINSYETGFDDYNLKDVKIVTERGTIKHPYNTSIEKRYHKIIEYKNGNKDYYRSYTQYGTIDDLMVVPHYKLVARQDRFGNVICFDLTDYGGMTIVDTWGRELKLEKNGNGLTWTLPEGVQGNKPSYAIEYTDTGHKPQKLMSATDLIDRKTEYAYYDKGVFVGKMRLGTPGTHSTEELKRPYMLLKNVKYPNDALTQFIFDDKKNISIKDDYDGYITHFPVLSKTDKIGDDVYNQVDYSYTLEKGIYIGSASVIRHRDIKETHGFSKEGLLSSKEIQEQDILVSKSDYEYNENKLLKIANVRVFDRNDESKELEKETTWEYDGEANITREKVEYKNDSAFDQEITTSYGDYSIILTTTRTKGSDTIKETNDLYPGKKQVIRCHKIYENDILKEKTVYDYGTSDYQYCVTSEKEYFLTDSGDLEKSGDCVETAYTYNSEKYTHACVSKERKGIKDADGNSGGSIKETFDYDNWGRIISKTDPRNQVSKFSYDYLGRVKVEELPSVSGQPVSNRIDYNDKGNYITKTDANLQKTRIQYTPLGQISQICLAASNQPSAADIVLKDFQYNIWGELVSVTTYDGNGTGTNHIRKIENYTYDSFGRVLSRTIPQVGYEERYDYDEVFADPVDGKKYYREQKSVKGDSFGADITTTLYKDQKGQIRKEFLAGNRMATYEYDNAGNNIRKIDAENKAERWEYDYVGRIVKSIRTDAGQERMVRVEYDALGNKRFSWDEAGKKTEFQYDVAGRLIQTIAPFDHRSQIIKYYYDAAGNVTWEKKLQDGGWQEIQHVYDARSRLTDTYQYLNQTSWLGSSYQYDVMDRVTLMRTGDTPSGDGGQVTKYTYDRFGNVMTITDARGCKEYYEYDKVGRLQGKTDRNGNRTVYQYDALERPVKETVQSKTAGGTMTSEREYAYSKTGKRIREASRETEDGKQTVFLETRYYYDEKGQLILQEDPGNAVKHSGNMSRS